MQNRIIKACDSEYSTKEGQEYFLFLSYETTLTFHWFTFPMGSSYINDK